MLVQLRQILSAPVFPDDPDKTAVAKTLNAITLFLFAILTLIPLVIVWLSRAVPPHLLLVIVGFVGLVGIKYLVQKGKTTVAGWLVFILFWVLSVLSFIPTGGVQAPGYSMLLFLVVLAGVLLGWRVALGVVILNSAVGLLFVWADSRGELPFSPLPDDDIRVWFFHTITALIIVLLLRVGLDSIRESLRRAQYELHQRQLSEARFTKIFKASPNAQIISELESGIIIDVNKSFESLLHYSKEMVIGRTATELNIYGDNGGRHIWIDPVEEYGFVHELEILLRRNGGEVRTCLVSIEAIELEGKPCAITFVQDITDRKQAEIEMLQTRDDLRAREAQLRTVLDNLPFWIWLKDVNGRFLLVNELLLQQFMGGIEMAQAIGKTDFDFTESEMAKRYLADEEEVMRTKVPKIIEEPALMLGEQKLNQTYKAPFLDNDNHLLGTFGYAYDITERKLAEQTLLESEARFRSIFEDAAIGMVLVNQNHAIERTNLAFANMLGYEEKELIGNYFKNITYPDDVGISIDSHKRLIRGELSNYQLEKRYRHKNGTIVWGLLNVSLVKTAQEASSYAIAQVQDITERKRAEEATLQTRDELRVREAQLRTILNNLPFWVWLKDMNGRFLLVNDQFRRRRQGKSDIGKTDFDLTTPELAKKYFADEKRVMETRLPISIEELVLIQGEYKLHETYKAPFIDEDDQLLGTFGFARDITEKKQAEVDREMLIQELERRNAELERFAYTVSHDLKSPLVTIGGFLGFLERDAESGNMDQLRADIGSIRSAADKMRLLLDELLELSRVGRLMNPPEEIPFSEIVQDAVATTQGQLMGGEVELVVADHFPTVFGDRVRLVEVVQNLVDNAAKFMGDQVHPCITIGVRQNEEMPVFFVQDNGIGIPQQHHEKIFDIFNKLDPDVDGTGIGLALVKRIVEVHNGRLWVESAGAEKGSTFCFTLNETESSEAQS